MLSFSWVNLFPDVPKVICGLLLFVLTSRVLVSSQSSTASFNHASIHQAIYCKIQIFLKISFSRRHFLEKAQVKLSSDTITHATAGHIVPVNHNKKVTVAVPLTTTNSVCVFVSYGGTNVDFVCQVPNQIELE